MAFVAKDQIVIIFELAIIEALCAFGAEEKHSLRITCFQERIPAFMDDNIQVFPVIHTGSFKMRFINNKTKRFYKMECCVCANTESANGSGILGDQRRNKNYIHRRLTGEGRFRFFPTSLVDSRVCRRYTRHHSRQNSLPEAG